MTASLAPEVDTLLQKMRALDLPAFDSLTPIEARGLRARTAALAAADPIAVDGTIVDGDIESPHGPLPVRMYTPTRWTRHSLVYFHGGGWVVGDLDTHDALCRALMNATGFRIVAVQYRLAPEHPYPAALEDAWVATGWLAKREPTPLAVGGDSAGGTLATCVAARARGTETRLAAQLLIYPVTDLRSFETASYREFAEGYWLTAKAMEWFRRHYVPAGTPLDHPDVSPLYRTGLTGMPPAVVVTAECDVLRDEGETYATRLRDAGNEVEYRCYKGMIHGFMAMPGALPQAEHAMYETGAALRRFMGAGG